MFRDFYHLREQPFGVTPDSRYLYLSRTHREALASLFYGVEMGRGFLALIAKPGMGKTTVLLRLLERLRKSTYTAFLFQTQCDSQEFLRSLVADMGIDSRGHDLVQMREELNEALVRLKCADRRFVLVIDEAQNLEDSVLETVRLLSDFETPSSKLMQIIIAGQPQLAAKLARPSLVQFRQRVAILCRLEPFSPAETDRYIDDRLQAAGYDGGPLFTPDARALIAERSGGIPRNINNLCFNALSMGYALKRKEIDREIVLEVVDDLDLESLIQKGDDAPQTDPPGSPTGSPRASASKRRGVLGARPFRATALAALLVLASLFLFPTVRRHLGTQLDRVFSGRIMPLAKAPSLRRPIAPPPASTTTPARQNVIAEPVARGAIPSGNPTVVVEAKPWHTLRQISVSYFGRYDQKLIQEIRALNPQITNINHLETGSGSFSPGEPRRRQGPILWVGQIVDR
jgi:type II secretory pathway predicted ATPase ExeA